MSTDSEEKKILRIPYQFSETQRKVAQNLLILGLPYDNAVESFLDRFPEFLEAESYELNEELTAAEKKRVTPQRIASEIRGIIRARLKEMQYNKRRNARGEIVEKKQMIEAILSDIPVMDPLHRVKELEIMRQDRSLKTEQRLKVFGAAIREANLLRSQEARFRPPGTVGLPDLPIAGENQSQARAASGSDQQTSEKGYNLLSGAMKKNANKGQETPEDS